MSFEWSVTCAYLTGMVVGFVLTKRFAFNARESGNTYREMVKFTIVSLLALLSTLAAAILTLRFLNHSIAHTSIFFRETAAHIVGMGCSFLTNYIGHKLFTFKSTGFYDWFNIRVRQKS